MMCLGPGFAGRCTPGFNFHSLVTLEVAISLADGFSRPGRGAHYLLSPGFAYSWLPPCGGLFLEDRATCAVMDTARKGPGTLTWCGSPTSFRNCREFCPAQAVSKEFLQANRLPAGPARLMDFYALAVLLLSAAVAGLTCRGTTATFFQYWTAVLLAGTPLAGAVAWSRPWCILSRRLQGRGALRCTVGPGLAACQASWWSPFPTRTCSRGKRQNERREVLLWPYTGSGGGLRLCRDFRCRKWPVQNL